MSISVRLLPRLGVEDDSALISPPILDDCAKRMLGTSQPESQSLFLLVFSVGPSAREHSVQVVIAEKFPPPRALSGRNCLGGGPLALCLNAATGKLSASGFF